MSEERPKNRKERRAAAKESGKAVEPPSSTPKMKLAQPDRSKPKGKTLLDVYEERKSLLEQGQPFDKKYEDGRVRDEGGNILQAGLGDGEPIGPVGDAIFYTSAFGMLHFTLDVLVYNQYAQEIVWPAIWKRTFTALPVLFTIIYLLRSDTARRFGMLRQIFFLIVSILTGCYTIHTSNKYDYFFVMKQTPPLGVLWIWSVIELRVEFAAASALTDLTFLWWFGYSII